MGKFFRFEEDVMASEALHVMLSPTLSRILRFIDFARSWNALACVYSALV